MMIRTTTVLAWIVGLSSLSAANAFTTTTTTSPNTKGPFFGVRSLSSSSTAMFQSSSSTGSIEISDSVGQMTDPEKRVLELVQDLHTSTLPFRIVVIGNGAILETTSILGPTCKVNKSPKSGEILATMASTDKSFEFHLKLGQVSKVTLTKREVPAEDRTMHVLRFITGTGTPICSLIGGNDTGEWFDTMLEKYGDEIQL
mmetsp:Transcript_10392/g.14671  ORF Transcript_10392/g.14671 Transcript_10392/m.14671 type:complete len:200 (+) Transcript_10392:73-672(+)